MQFVPTLKRTAPPWFAAMLLLALAVTALAQTSASLSGSVQDSNGGAMNGAKVTVSDPARNISFDTKTNSDGTFSFPVLQPGSYTVTIEA